MRRGVAQAGQAGSWLGQHDADRRIVLGRAGPVAITSSGIEKMSEGRFGGRLDRAIRFDRPPDLGKEFAQQRGRRDDAVEALAEADDPGRPGKAFRNSRGVAFRPVAEEVARRRRVQRWRAQPRDLLAVIKSSSDLRMPAHVPGPTERR